VLSVEGAANSSLSVSVKVVQQGFLLGLHLYLSCSNFSGMQHRLLMFVTRFCNLALQVISVIDIPGILAGVALVPELLKISVACSTKY